MEVDIVPSSRHRRQRPSGRYHPLGEWIENIRQDKQSGLKLLAKLELMPELQNFQVTWLGYGRACQIVSPSNEFYFATAEYTWQLKTKCMSLLAAIESYEKGLCIGQGAKAYPNPTGV